MTVYNVLFFVVLAAGIGLCEINKRRRTDAIFLAATSVLLVVIASLRADTVGVDYNFVYAPYFNDVCNSGFSYIFSPQNPYLIEVSYSLINWLVSLVTHDVRVLMLVVAVLSTALTAAVLYKYCAIPWVGMLVYVGFGFFGNSMSFLRQSLGIAVFLFALHFLMERKLAPYLLLVLLAATFHKSLLVMLPFYWIAWIPVNWKTLSAYAAGTALVWIFSWQIFYFITGTLGLFSFYATWEGIYYMNPRNWQTAAVPVLCMIAAVALKKWLLERSPQNRVLINFTVYGGILFILTCKHFLFQRFGVMFFTAAILFVPEMLACALPKPEEAPEKPAAQKKLSKQERREAQKVRRGLQGKRNTQVQVYHWALAGVAVVAFAYNLFLLYSNRIDLVPYTTWFQS